MLVALNRMVQSRIAYIVRMEPGVWTPEETLGNARGSCRDSAWVLVQLLRNLGYAARFVSGYLIQLVADVKPLDGPAGPTADFTDLHAWAEVYLPGAGWIGLDATSGLLAGEGHIPLAASPDPMSAAPISGVVEPCEVQFRIRNVGAPDQRNPARHQAVHRGPVAGHPGHRRPRRSRPGRGRRAPDPRRRADLRRRRRHGRAGVEHRRAGPHQARLCRAAAAPAGAAVGAGGGAAIRHGQAVSGRATAALGAARALARGWRDGVDRSGAAGVERRHRYRAGDRRGAIRRRCWRSGCRSIRTWSFRPTRTSTTTCGASGRCPPTWWSRTPSCATRWNAARLAHVFSHGLAAPVGSVLPLRRVIADGVRRWQSGKWFFRGDTMFLIPGDSPIGLRLPLESLPWVDPETIEYEVEPDPFAPRPPFASAQAIRAALHRPAGGAAAGFRRRVPAGGAGRCRWSGATSRALVRTALTVEAARRPAAHFSPAAVRRRGLAGAGRRDRSDRAENSAARWSWRATSRRTIRGCCISPSRPIPG